LRLRMRSVRRMTASVADGTDRTKGASEIRPMFLPLSWQVVAAGAGRVVAEFPLRADDLRGAIVRDFTFSDYGSVAVIKDLIADRLIHPDIGGQNGSTSVMSPG
jgi:hypothetical protein